MTRILSGVADQGFYFVALDSLDYSTRKTGLSAFTVVRSRNGAADATMTTPTITEIDATTMPGVYFLLCDEDTTIDSGDDEQEMAFHITCAGMVPVTKVVDLCRPKITAGFTSANQTGDASTQLLGLFLSSDAAVGGTGNDTTHVHLSGYGAAYGDDELNDYLLTIKDVSAGVFYTRWIEDWVSATSLATVATLPFTPVSGDRHYIMAVSRKIGGYAVAGTYTMDNILRLIAATEGGKVSGAGTTTIVFRDMADTKDVLSVTVDADGNRTVFGTRDLT